MKIRKHLVLVLALTLLMSFTAFPAAAGKKDDTLNIALEKELETLDWYFNTAREGIVLSEHVYDFLIYRDPVTFEHKPLLATSWKWLSDTVLELELRRGVVFHTEPSSRRMTWSHPQLRRQSRQQGQILDRR